MLNDRNIFTTSVSKQSTVILIRQTDLYFTHRNIYFLNPPKTKIKTVNNGRFNTTVNYKIVH